MVNDPKIYRYKGLPTLAQRLRSDLKDIDCVLLYAYNRTGKTRLSMEFKDQAKRRSKGATDTLYFNAFTEDLFVWENDLDGDSDRHMTLNSKSTFFKGLTELALDETIAGYLSRYADFDFDIDYTTWKVAFRKDDHDRIKISRGEENLFVWSMFMAICERVIDGHPSYQRVKYLYIDDPISSLDDNNAIAVACDLAGLIRKAATRRDTAGIRSPLRTVFSSHHPLFFNIMCNELSRTPEGEDKVKSKRYFLHQPNAEGAYSLRATGDTPYFNHVATLAELTRCVKADILYTYHFNALRTVLEKTASFFGQESLAFCLQDMKDKALYSRALNVLSHGKYSISEPVEMVEDNKVLFRRILSEFLERFAFAIPELLPGASKQKATL
jgi:hypothetical protein